MSGLEARKDPGVHVNGWVEDPDADDDETAPGAFNEDFESDCYGVDLDDD